MKIIPEICHMNLDSEKYTCAISASDSVALVFALVEKIWTLITYYSQNTKVRCGSEFYLCRNLIFEQLTLRISKVRIKTQRKFLYLTKFSLLLWIRNFNSFVSFFDFILPGFPLVESQFCHKKHMPLWAKSKQRTQRKPFGWREVILKAVQDILVG